MKNIRVGNPAPSPDFPQDVENVGSNINLFDKDNANIIIDGYINITNKTIISSNDAKTLYIPCKPNSFYTVSRIAGARFAVISSTSYETGTVGTNQVYSQSGATTLTIITGENDNYICVFYYSGTYDTLTEQEIRNSIKIEEGLKETGYSKYNAGSIDFKINGKIITSTDTTWTANKYLDSSGNEVDNNSWKYSNYIDVSKGSYYINCGASGTNPKHILYNKDKEMIGYLNVINGILKIDDNAYYIRVSIGTSAVSTLKIYQEQKVTVPLPANVELCKIRTYKDYIYKSGDKWYKHKEIGKLVLDGSESLDVNTKQTTFVRIYYDNSNIKIAENNSDIFCLSDNFNAISYSNILKENLNMIAISNNAHRIFINVDYSLINETSSSSNTNIINAFKTWLTTHNTEVYYVLATPVEEEITDTDTLNALYKLEHFPIFKEYTTIECTNEVKPTIQAQYLYDNEINNYWGSVVDELSDRIHLLEIGE